MSEPERPDNSDGPERPKKQSAAELFRDKNFSFFFSAQLLSNTGAWFQNLALALIIVERTSSASALSFVTVAQFAPILLLAGVAGKVADSMSPRKLLMLAALFSASTASCLAIMVATSDVAIGWLYALIAVAGCANAFERVSAQAFIFELVGAEKLKNAVLLNTVAFSSARSIGPGLAGVVFLTLGPVMCLVVNAIAYATVFVLLLLVNPKRLTRRRSAATEKVSLKQVFTEIRANLDLRVILVVNLVIAIAAMNMNLVLTSAVTITFDGGAGELGLLHVLNAVGAIVGGYLLTRVDRISAATLGPALIVFSVCLAIAAGAPNLLWFLIVGPILGVGIGIYQGVLQSSAQVSSPPEMLGRTMSLVTMGNLGVAPFGAVLLGMLIDATSSRVAIAIGATVALLSAIAVWLIYRNRKN